MSIVLQTGIMQYREDENDSWHPMVIKADVDYSKLIEEYSSSKTYLLHECCYYDGKFYCANQAITTAEEWNSAHWDETDIGEEIKRLDGRADDLQDITGNGSLSGFTATDLTGAANELKNTLNSLENRFSIVSTGSLHDITTSGVYYVTGAVTDKPASSGGFYVVSAFNNEQLVGKYISFYNEEYNVSLSNNVWTYTHAFGYAATTVSGRTTSSGAIDVPLAYANNVYVNARITAGGPGFVIRRDAGYFTVFDNTGNPLGNTDVTFIAYFFT